MSITVVNRLGFFMMLAAFGLAYAMRLQWSWLSDGILLALAAGMCLALDIFWRVGKGKRKWFRTANGGSIVCMPLWLLGLAWLGLCVYQMCVGPIPALAKAAPQMTWTTSAQAQPQTQSQAAEAKKQ
jgi:hypothetical protein